jgi:hypothetical protein
VIAQLISVGFGLGAGTFVYARAVLWLRIEEAQQTWALVSSRLAALRS